MGTKNARYLVGTSGWTYPDWQGLFYPEDWPKSRWFDYYAGIFPTVEVNATYYRRFKEQTFLKWRMRAPAGFLYVLKIHRIITHRKYLRDAQEEIASFWSSAALLGDKLGLVLLQLAPRTPYDLSVLERALLTFPDPRKVAVEFRNEQWLTDETRMLLERTGSVFCSVDSPEMDLLDWVTSDAAYIRMHGRDEWYAYDYSDRELADVALLAQRMAEHGAQTVFVFFNNDFRGYAPKNAATLMNMLCG